MRFLGGLHRKRVALLGFAQLLLGALALGDVAPDAAIAEKAALRVVARLAAELVEALLAVSTREKRKSMKRSRAAIAARCAAQAASSGEAYGISQLARPSFEASLRTPRYARPGSSAV